MAALHNFTSLARSSAGQARGPHTMLLDSHVEFQAWCMQQLWRDVLSLPTGIDDFVAW